MNILPKKRWHVRTKDNIARVRRDEALAAEEEKKKQLRIETAEREARSEALRKKARAQYGSHGLDIPEKPTSSSDIKEETIFGANKHVNLFYELENNEIVSNKPNEEHEEEKRLEKEKYEKQIGYLVYLGQDTNELTGNVSWYNKLEREGKNDNVEVSQKQKKFEDPLVGIRKYLGCEGVKNIVATNQIKIKNEKHNERKRNKSDSSDSERSKKKRKKSKHKKKESKEKKRKHKKNKLSDSDSYKKIQGTPKSTTLNLERLRNERLKRELQERQRANEIFAKINGVNIKKEKSPPQPVQKYNSQFNPHLAKQNF